LPRCAAVLIGGILGAGGGTGGSASAKACMAMASLWYVLVLF